MGEHAALRRPGGAGRVDDRGDVVGADGVEPALQLGLLDLAGAGSQVGDRAWCRRPAPCVHDVLERRAAAAHRLDLRELRGVLADDRAGAGVGEHVPALLGRVRVVDRHDDGAGGQQRGSRRASTPGACSPRIATRSPGSMPSATRPPAISRTALPSSANDHSCHVPSRGKRIAAPLWRSVESSTIRPREFALIRAMLTQDVTPEPRRFSRRRAPWPEGSCRARRCSSARARAPPRPDRPRSRARPRRCARRSTSRRGTGGRCPRP